MSGIGEKRGQLTWPTAGPPQHLIQESSLVQEAQRDLPVAQLLLQATVQQAQHHVVGRTGPLGERDTLWLWPTYTLLSTEGFLLPSAPRPTLAGTALLLPCWLLPHCSPFCSVP